MIKGILKKIVASIITGVMSVSMLMTGNVAKAAGEEIEINETNFPDEIFRDYIETNFDKDNDGYLSQQEIEKIKTIILNNCEEKYGKPLKNVKGIEYFEKLEYLDVSENELTEIDVSNNVNLEQLKLHVNKIEEIDISNNINLWVFDCECNKIEELDLTNNVELMSLCCGSNKLKELDVSKNINLDEIVCYENELVELDVTKNTELTMLLCENNNLKELDLSKNKDLWALTCSYNELTELDISNNPELYGVECDNNNLEGLDVSNNSELGILICDNNKLTELDLSNNPLLEQLICSNNSLTELDLSNNPELAYLECKNNDIEILNIPNADNLSKFDYDEEKVHVIEKTVTNIQLNNNEVGLKKDQTTQLIATVVPADADITEVKWTSSDETVAKVDENGLVTAVSEGTAVITVLATDYSGILADCTIKVVAEDSGTSGGDSGNTGGDSGSAGGNSGNTGSDSGNLDTKNYPAVNISYRTHIQSFGWEGTAGDITTWKSNGTMSGTSGKAKRLEGINIVVDSADSKADLDLGIQYTTHCQSYGWLPWSANGEMNGTEGEAKRLEAIKIQLTGADKDAYDVYYRVHAQTYGWLGWASNGAPAGTAGYAKRLEGIQIVVVKKGESFNQKMENITSGRTDAFVAQAGDSPIVNYPATSNTNPVVPGAEDVNVAYRTHVQSYGWQGWKYNGQMSGTSGKAKRLEGINIELRNQKYSGDIVYTTHVQSYGWQGSETDQSKWFKNGAMAGTSGEAKRLEAICINLTGDMAANYDIYYRVHAQSYGWLGWAKNGEPSGTAGYAKRLEGIQVVLVPKNGAAPGDYQGITSDKTEAYIKK